MQKKLLSCYLVFVMMLAELSLMSLSVRAVSSDIWTDAKEVTSFAEFSAALRNREIQSVIVTGKITITETLTSGKPVLIRRDAALRIAGGKTFTSTAPENQFLYEDSENTWKQIAESCGAYFQWQDDDRICRVLFGSQSDAMSEITNQEYGNPVILAFCENDVTLEHSISGVLFKVLNGHSLTMTSGVNLSGLLPGSVVEGNVKQLGSNPDRLDPNLEILGQSASFQQFARNAVVSSEDFVRAETEKPETTPTLSSSVSMISVSPFEDVSVRSPYYQGILWAASHKITEGVSATQFAPDEQCLRSQIITFLWRAAGSPEPSDDQSESENIMNYYTRRSGTVASVIGNETEQSLYPAQDVTNPAVYYYQAVQWARKKNLFEGTLFGPNDPCTRSDAVEFIWKASGSPEANTTSVTRFSDVSEKVDYAQAINWAVTQGIVRGVTDTTFAPDAICTRGQIVTFLYRAAQAGSEVSQTA